MTKPNESHHHKIFQQYKLYATEIDMIVNEFGGDFNITRQLRSKERHEELTNKLKINKKK